MYTNTFRHVFRCAKMTFSIKDFISKCDQIRSLLRIWFHLLNKSSMENLILCAVYYNKFCSKWKENIFITCQSFMWENKYFKTFKVFWKLCTFIFKNIFIISNKVSNFIPSQKMLWEKHSLAKKFQWD